MTVADEDVALALRRGGEALWQGTRYVTAALVAALAFAAPVALGIGLRWALVVLRLFAALLTGRYASVADALAGVLVMPVLLLLLAALAVLVAVAFALGLSFGLLTPAALLAHLAFGRRGAGGGLASGLALLVAGVVSGLAVAVPGHLLLLRVLPEFAPGGWALARWLGMGGTVGLLAGAAYWLTLAGLAELRIGARRVVAWAQSEQSVSAAARLAEPTPPTLSRVA